MPDFHDPETRKMMEAEGWTYPFDHQCHFWLERTRVTITLFNEILYLDIDFRQDDGGFSEISLPMSSFQAAKDAADAILKGVAG